MRRAFLHRTILALLLLTFSAPAALRATAETYTPLVASVSTPRVFLFPATDGKQHIVYELSITNASPKPVTFQKIEVLDSANPPRVLATYEGAALTLRLRKMSQGPSSTAEIEVNGSRLFFVDLDFDSSATPPTHLLHRLSILAAPAGASSPTSMTYTAAPTDIVARVIKIGPPLTGNGWVVNNGCCVPGSAHRSTGLPINGEVHFAQRFAIDWMRIDEQGRLAHGVLSDVDAYTGYGADVIAVADGTVTEAIDKFQNQKPSASPDPGTITLENIGGNHIIQDLGNGVFAFYAHLQPNSIKVAEGSHVKRGQILAHLGNTGNTSAPHLHFHLMDGPSMLASSGIPYTIDFFAFAGQIKEETDAPEVSLDASLSKALFLKPIRRHDQFPLDLTILNFAPSR